MCDILHKHPCIYVYVYLYIVYGLYSRDLCFCQRVVVPVWWRHQMETFSALLALRAGNSPVTGEFPSQRSVTRSLDVFFDLRLTKRVSKQSKRQWFETRSRSFWRHCDVVISTFRNDIYTRLHNDVVNLMCESISSSAKILRYAARYYTLNSVRRWHFQMNHLFSWC